MGTMEIFSQFKGNTKEASFCLHIDSKLLSIPADLSLECRAAGPWLLSIDDWLQLMKDSRELNSGMYFSRFPPSLGSLVEYLSEGPLGNQNQILFLLIDQVGNLHGHIGLKLDSEGNVEIDNVLRISSDFPGIMRIALNKIMLWGQRYLGFRQYFLKVISTNDRAIKLYRDLGFALRESIPLKVKIDPNGLTNLSPTSKEESNTKEEMFIMEKFI